MTDSTDERERRSRLGRAAEAVLARYAVRIERIELLHHEFNCLFRLGAAGGARYGMRFTNTAWCHDLAETHAEVAWLEALARDTDVRVPRPVAMRDGSFVALVDRDLAPDHGQHLMFEWTDGWTLGDRIGPRTAGELGTIAAALHEHALSFELPAHARARRFDRPFPYSDESLPNREPVLVFDDAWRHVFPAALRDVYAAAEREVLEITDALFAREAPRLIHNDLHPWNVIRSADRLAVIDFEDLMWGYPVQDLATTSYYLRIRENGPRLEAAFRAGYERRRPWPAASDRELAVLIAGRGLILMNTVLASPEPSTRTKATHYATLIGKRIEGWLASS